MITFPDQLCEALTSKLWLYSNNFLDLASDIIFRKCFNSQDYLYGIILHHDQAPVSSLKNMSRAVDKETWLTAVQAGLSINIFTNVNIWMCINFSWQSISKVPLKEFFFSAINFCKGVTTSLVQPIIVPGYIKSLKIEYQLTQWNILWSLSLYYSFQDQNYLKPIRRHRRPRYMRFILNSMFRDNFQVCFF